MIDKYRILYLLALSLIAAAQISGPEGHCLGYCSNCDPNALTKCKGPAPCQWGFYDPRANGNCSIIPSLQIVSEQLGERVNSATAPFLAGWIGESKLSKCEYFALGKKAIVDVLGLFDGSISMQKQFAVPLGAQQLELSFSLLRDEWLPLNDFLMVEIADVSKTLEMFQISYQTRASVTPQMVNLTCNKKQVIVEKYRIRISKAVTTDRIRVVFSSFLYRAVWGLTNIKLIAGCSAYTGLDRTSSKCSKCNTGDYFADSYAGYGACQSCPGLCKTCKDENTCLSCHWGTLVDSKCVPPEAYKSQNISLGSGVVGCSGKQIVMSQASNKISLPAVRNDQNALFDEILLMMTVYFDPFELKSDKGELMVAVNGQFILSVNLEASTTFTDECQFLGSGRVSRYRLVGQSILVNDNSVVVSVEGEGVKRFGVSDVVIYSINKEVVKNKSQKSQTGEVIGVEIAEPSQTITEDKKESLNSMESGLEMPSQSGIALKVSAGDSKQAIVIAPGDSSAATGLKIDNESPALSDTFSYSQSSSGTLEISIKKLSKPVTGTILVQIDKLSSSDYELVSNYYSNEELIIVIRIVKSFRDGTVSIKAVEGRRLQEGLLQTVAVVEVDRFDAYSDGQLSRIKTFSTFFTVFAWFGLISIAIAVLSGFGVVVEEYVIALQMLYLHVFIGFDSLPLTFKEVLSGLRGIGFLNFFSSSSASNGMSLSPESQFWLLPGDFNFLVAYLPLFLTISFFSVWFVLLLGLKKWVLPRSIPDQSRSWLHILADGIVCRVLNFIDVIWRYQLMAVLLICVLEFISGHWSGFGGECVCALLVLMGNVSWCVFSEVYVRNQYYQNEYSYFVYQFEDRYFCKIPLNSLPSRHHRFGYPLLRIGKCLLVVLLVLLVSSPVVVLLLLMAVHAFQMWYITFNSIYSDLRLLKFKIFQNSLLLLLEIVMLVLLVARHSLTSSLYTTWGWMLSVVGLLVVLNGLIRAVFVARLKLALLRGVSFQEVDLDRKKLQGERAV